MPVWEELYTTLGPALARYCTALCRGDAAAGEDMAQEVFLRALQNTALLGDLSPRQRRAWLYKTARNLAADRARRAGLAQQHAAALWQPEPAPDTGLAAVEAAALLAALPQEDRDLFALHTFAGYTAAELARRLHCPAATVRSRLARIRTKLQATLKEE